MTDKPLSDLLRARAGQTWCLFVDRDGVINKRIIDGYVRSWSDFEFLRGAVAALAQLSQWAPRIVVVTNQQGIGKGLMSEGDLADIHARMSSAIRASGGRIDSIEYCPHLAADGCSCRKPSPEMALRYLRSHTDIDARLSIMVGDTDSDIEMGHRLSTAVGGCVTVRIGDHIDPHADLTFRSLAAFAAAVAAP